MLIGVGGEKVRAIQLTREQILMYLQTTRSSDGIVKICHGLSLHPYSVAGETLAASRVRM